MCYVCVLPTQSFNMGLHMYQYWLGNPSDIANKQEEKCLKLLAHKKVQHRSRSKGVCTYYYYDYKI